MALLQEVVMFLQTFFSKMEIWGLYFRTDRTNDKNSRTLWALELNYSNVRVILKSLTPEDYSEGPLPDKLNNISPMWVFGKKVKGEEVYIKIQIGAPASSTICISFHFPAHPMHYPLKKK